MRSLFLRYLVLGCSLLLALPPGWCCIFQVQARSKEVKAEVPRPIGSCCGHCRGVVKPQVPTRTPVPALPGKCPCDDRHSTTPDAHKIVGGDLLIATTDLVHDLVLSAAEAEGLAGLPVPSSDHSLRILHCVWLC
jgi:hypothetical protein